MTPPNQGLKCHFDADGWLQGPINITHYLSPNHYATGFADSARGMVQHTEDGFTAGTVSTFMSEASQVSAFFGVGEDGAAQQFLPVGRGFVAWAEGGGNPLWRSCECEDKTNVGHAMTQPQMVAFAQILEACSAYDGFPLQVTDDPVNGKGLITHGAGGSAWGGHYGCPGDVRKAQRPQLVKLAQQIRAEGGVPAPLPADWVFGNVQKLAASVGSTSVKLTWSAPAGPDGAPAVKFYEIAASEGKTLAAEAPSYPRQVAKGTGPEVWQGGSLTPGKTYTFGVRALAASGDPEHASDWATITVTLR